MLKRILISIAICLYLTPFVGCTSNNSKDDSTEPYQEVTDLEAVEGVDVTSDTSAPSEATVDPVSPIAESTQEEKANVDGLPQDPLAEVDSTNSQDIAESSPSMESSNTEVIPPSTIEQPAEMSSLPPEPPAPVADNFSAPMTETKSVAATSEPTYMQPPKKSKKAKKVVDESASQQVAETMAPPVEEPVMQKVIAQPWRDGEVLFNAVYFARAGENYSSISKKIYGNSKKQELLKKGNPGIAKVKAGDAIYYSSPNRPDDETKVLTFAEDNGVAPEIYVAKSGDNLKVISKKLLGYSGAWKEVWATNAIEGMSTLQEGAEIKYWKANAKPKSTVAMNTAASEVAPPAEVASSEMPTAPQDNMMPPPPPQEMMPPPADMNAQNSMPPPPTDPAMAAATAQELPPPPPPPAIPQDPPQNVVKAKGKQTAEAEVAPAEAIDQETLNMLIALAIVSAGVVAFVVVRKKRKNKEMEQILQNTQVG